MLTSKDDSATMTNPMILPTITTFLWVNSSPKATQNGATAKPEQES